jgi:hypothetical protein
MKRNKKYANIEDSPTYQALLKQLREQTPERLEALKEYLDSKIKEDEKPDER